jgi:hypothetical protein
LWWRGQGPPRFLAVGTSSRTYRYLPNLRCDVQTRQHPPSMMTRGAPIPCCLSAEGLPAADESALLNRLPYSLCRKVHAAHPTGHVAALVIARPLRPTDFTQDRLVRVSLMSTCYFIQVHFAPVPFSDPDLRTDYERSRRESVERQSSPITSRHSPRFELFFTVFGFCSDGGNPGRVLD